MAIALLGVAVLYLGSGGLSRVFGGLSSALGGFVTSVTATPTPKPSLAAVADAPTLQEPNEPYTQDSTVDLVVTVPPGVIGDASQRIRVYLALKDQPPKPVQEASLSATAQTIVPVELTKGINDFSVTIVGPGGESQPSAVVRYVLDQAPAKITITSPTEGAVVNGDTVSIVGKTQGRSTLIAHNAANGASITGTAAVDGTFKLSLALGTGINEITITGTDPAGNAKNLVLTVRRGNGKLTASLSATAYRISVAKLPADLTLRVTVSDPDGNALVGAAVTFTLSIPGIPTVTGDEVTDANGASVVHDVDPGGRRSGTGPGHRPGVERPVRLHAGPIGHHDPAGATPVVGPRPGAAPAATH